ncbi:MAG: rhomboid family intramembrane serine protease [Candidatus Anstonellales archaeon]
MRYSATLLGLIAFCFLLQLLIPGLTEALYFEPSKVFSEPWRWISSMFLHGGFMHIFLNGFALLMFGPIVERKLSASQFLALYFASGIAGSLFYYLSIVAGIIPPIPALGASGAIYGILGAAAVLFPDMVVYTYFVPLRMRYAAILWAFLALIGSFDAGSGIASAAHLGGLVVGYLMAKHYKSKEDDLIYFYQEIPPEVL